MDILGSKNKSWLIPEDNYFTTPLTIEELEKRIARAEEDIKAGRVYTTDEVRKYLGL